MKPSSLCWQQSQLFSQGHDGCLSCSGLSLCPCPSTPLHSRWYSLQQQGQFFREQGPSRAWSTVFWCSSSFARWPTPEERVPSVHCLSSVGVFCSFYSLVRLMCCCLVFGVVLLCYCVTSGACVLWESVGSATVMGRESFLFCGVLLGEIRKVTDRTAP